MPSRLQANAKRWKQLHFVALHVRETFVRGCRCDFSKHWRKIAVDAAHACVGNCMLIYVLEIKLARCFLQVDSSDVVSRRCCKGLIVTASSVLFWMFW